MNIKEFFKPSKWKIFLFSILLIAWFFLPALPVLEYTILVCITTPCDPAPSIHFISFFHLMFGGFGPKDLELLNLSIAIVIIDILVLYIMACAIVYLHGKRKNNVVIS